MSAARGSSPEMLLLAGIVAAAEPSDPRATNSSYLPLSAIDAASSTVTHPSAVSTTSAFAVGVT